jgi:hypothetical protein
VSYLGLHENVRYRLEIGLAYIDDGAAVHRFDDALFAELRAAVVATPTDTGFDPVRALLTRFPSVFRAYDEQPAAEDSFASAQLAEALA